MRIEYLHYFVSVVDAGSISKAANLLFISPQGLSQAIQKLEQELDVALFYREGSRLELTQAGKDTYDMAQDILTLSRNMTDRLAAYRANTDDAARNELRIISAPIINATFLPKVLNQLRKRYPGLRILVDETDPDDMVRKFEAAPNAVLILSMPELEIETLLRDTPKALDFYELYRTPLMACVSIRSPLAHRNSISISEYHKYSLIVYGVEDRLLRHLSLDDDLQQIVLRSGNLQMCRTMLAAENSGIGFSNAIVERYLRNQSLSTIPLLPSTDMLFGFLATPEYARNPIMQEFARLMKGELHEP